MNYLAIYARWLFLSFFILLALTLLLKFLVDDISLKGLLAQKSKHGLNHLSVGRIQLLVVTTAVALNYLRDLVAKSSGSSMPDISRVTIWILGASQMFYLAGKARVVWLGHASQISPKG